MMPEDSPGHTPRHTACSLLMFSLSFLSPAAHGHYHLILAFLPAFLSAFLPTISWGLKFTHPVSGKHHLQKT